MVNPWMFLKGDTYTIIMSNENEGPKNQLFIWQSTAKLS